jgi:hypothetical protein
MIIFYSASLSYVGVFWLIVPSLHLACFSKSFVLHKKEISRQKAKWEQKKQGLFAWCPFTTGSTTLFSVHYFYPLWSKSLPVRASKMPYWRVAKGFCALFEHQIISPRRKHFIYQDFYSYHFTIE